MKHEDPAPCGRFALDTSGMPRYGHWVSDDNLITFFVGLACFALVVYMVFLVVHG